MKKSDNSFGNYNKNIGTRIELADTNDNTVNLVSRRADSNLFKKENRIESQNVFINNDNLEEEKELKNNNSNKNKFMFCRSAANYKNPFFVQKHEK